MCKVDRMRNPAVLVCVCCALGCGDNSKECGPGTVDQGGECVPAANCGFGTKHDDVTGECVPDGTTVCSDGTVFDPLTGTCKLDPSACHDGSVLIGDACVDPTAGLTIDVQEGPEPNGLGIVEASQAQAGNVALKPAGETFVIHGTLAPWRDTNNDGVLEPDVDTFVVGASAPTWLRMTADGVHGTTAGFVMVSAFAPNDPMATLMASWRRFGIHLVGDTSKREVFLPAAGTYRIAIGDTRTLAEYLTSGTATGTLPPGDYYVSLTDLGPVMPATLTSNTVNGSFDNESLKFYAPAAGQGITQATLTMPSDLVLASVVVMVNGALRGLADETSLPAKVMTGSLMTGDTTYVVVDHVYDQSPSPAAFTLGVNTQNL